ncbi:hypothetical protein BaRGS_00023715, partial [Batillaria attramentaria]
GVLANSLALFTDVLHLASDLISYAISLLALYLSRKKATRSMTFGYHRAEVLGALFSVFIIWLVSGVLCYIAVERIIHEHYKDVKPNEMLITATLGVVFNLIMGFVLHSEKAAFIHVVGDIIQSLGVLIAALIIKFKDEEKYRLADPICTFLFSLLVLLTTINVLRDTIRIIMEGAPQGVDFEHLKSVLMSLDSVITVHNLNVWALTMDRNALSVHLAVDGSQQSMDVLQEATKALKQHNFFHVTIQVEPYNHDVMTACLDCQLPTK